MVEALMKFATPTPTAMAPVPLSIFAYTGEVIVGMIAWFLIFLLLALIVLTFASPFIIMHLIIRRRRHSETEQGAYAAAPSTTKLAITRPSDRTKGKTRLSSKGRAAILVLFLLLLFTLSVAMIEKENIGTAHIAPHTLSSSGELQGQHRVLFFQAAASSVPDTGEEVSDINFFWIGPFTIVAGLVGLLMLMIVIALVPFSPILLIAFYFYQKRRAKRRLHIPPASLGPRPPYAPWHSSPPSAVYRQPPNAVYREEVFPIRGHVDPQNTCGASRPTASPHIPVPPSHMHIQIKRPSDRPKEKPRLSTLGVVCLTLLVAVTILIGGALLLFIGRRQPPSHDVSASAEAVQPTATQTTQPVF